MNEEEKKKIFSNDFIDFIFEYHGDRTILNERYKNYTYNIIDGNFAVIYYPISEISEKLVGETGYSVIPKLYGLVQSSALDELGVTRVQNIPAFNLRGQGVLIGIVDTGIDYQNPIFQYENNTTRILSIWDQTVENMEAGENIFSYGKEYSMNQINDALSSNDPLSLVPALDEFGHGTMIAGISGGSKNEANDFEGVAPLSEFVVVKLKEAKENIRTYFSVPEGVAAFMENDIMTGVTYLVNYANEVKRPIAICIGLGTTQTSHDGKSSLSFLLNTLSEQVGVAVSVAAGNEGNAGHHFYGVIDPISGYETMEVTIAEGESGFPMQIWGYAPGNYSIDILSPAGEYIPRIPARLGEYRAIQFLFESTYILIDYILVEAQAGDQLILVRFRNPTPGVWRFRVYGKGNIGQSFHSWLPLSGFIKEGTVFLRPNPETTITGPGNTQNVITVTAYNHQNNSLYLNAGKGFTRTNIIKPELAAPGVNISVPTLDSQYESRSGTSIASAYTTGITVLLLEWGIIRSQYRSISTAEIKKFLIRGARRFPQNTYPNKEWGYGIIDIYNTFNSLREEME